VGWVCPTAIVRGKREGKHIVHSLAEQHVFDLMGRGKFGERRERRLFV
jgi:hypothetical protein